MKRINFLLVALTALLTASCWKGGGLLDQIPAEADLVLTGNVQTIIESAGGSLEDSKLKLPGWLLGELPGDVHDGIDEINGFLKKSGINTDNAAMFMDIKKEMTVIVFSLDDKKLFVKKIEDLGFREKDDEDGVVYYEKSDSRYWGDYIAVKGSYAYYIPEADKDEKPVRFLEDAIEEAHGKSFAKTSWGAYIASGNAMGFALNMTPFQRIMREEGMPAGLLSMYDGVLCMRGDLTRDKCLFDIKFYDENGKDKMASLYKDYMDVNASIDSKALSYLGEDEFMVYAASMKDVDWDRYADMLLSGLSRSERAQANAVLGYLEKFNGTVAFGFGLAGGLDEIGEMASDEDKILSNMSMTLVVEAKKGKADQLLNDLKGFMEQADVDFDDNASGFTVDMARNAGMDGTIYAKTIGDFIVMANHPIKEGGSNPVVKTTKMSSCLQAFGIVLNKNNKLMRDLEMSDDIIFTTTCMPRSMDMAMTLEIPGGKDGFIAKAAKIVLGLAKQADKIEEAFDSGYGDYYDWDYDYDYDW